MYTARDQKSKKCFHPLTIPTLLYSNSNKMLFSIHPEQSAHSATSTPSPGFGISPPHVLQTS